MKIKFEVKSNPKVPSSNTLYTIFMENKTEEGVELLITKFNLSEINFGNHAVEKRDVPISDGLLLLNKPNLKNFIKALKLIYES